MVLVVGTVAEQRGSAYASRHLNSTEQLGGSVTRVRVSPPAKTSEFSHARRKFGHNVHA